MWSPPTYNQRALEVGKWDRGIENQDLTLNILRLPTSNFSIWSNPLGWRRNVWLTSWWPTPVTRSVFSQSENQLRMQAKIEISNGCIDFSKNYSNGMISPIRWADQVSKSVFQSLSDLVNIRGLINSENIIGSYRSRRDSSRKSGLEKNSNKRNRIYLTLL